MSNVLKKVVGGYDELYYQYANRRTWKERLEIARRSKKAIAEAEKKRKEKEAAKAKEEAEKKPEEQKQEVKDEKSETTTAEKVSGEVVDGKTNQEVKQDEDKISDKIADYIKSQKCSDSYREVMIERANITNEMVKFISWYIGASGAPAGGYSAEDQEFINGLIVYLKEKYPDDVKVEIPYPDAKTLDYVAEYDVSGKFAGFISYLFDSEDILKNIRKIRNQYVMVQKTFEREAVDTSTKSAEEVKEIIEDTQTPEFHKIEPEKVVPFKISEPSAENTFILKDGEQSPAEDDNGTPVVNLGEFTDDEKKKLDEISLEVNKLLGPTPIQFMRNISGLVDMYLLRPNGYTDVYSIDIAGLTNGGTKSRIAINVIQLGPLYVPFNNPLVKKALQNKFYLCSEEEYKQDIEKFVYPPMFYNFVDFSGIKTDIEDNTKFRANLSKVLDKIMEVNKIVPKMKLYYNSETEFRLVSADEKVSRAKAKYSHGTIKIKKGEDE